MVRVKLRVMVMVRVGFCVRVSDVVRVRVIEYGPVNFMCPVYG